MFSYIPGKVYSLTPRTGDELCLARLLPGIISLLLISQVFSEALTLWGSPNA